MLRVQNPKVIDSGRYSCKVTTESGVCITTANVKIVKSQWNAIDNKQESSLIIMKPEDVTATTDSAVSFAVRVSDDTVNVKWFICGREVTRSDRGVLVSNVDC